MSSALVNKYNHLVTVLICCIGVFVFEIQAKAQINHVHKGLNEVNDACSSSPVDCITLVERELARTPKNTYIWYDLLQHKFDALFDLQKMRQLKEEITPWIDQKKLPNSFLITVYIYYSKTSYLASNITDAKQYAYKAKEKILALNQVFPSPMRLIMLANLQMNLDEPESAYEVLKALETKYKQSKNAYFMMELYGNLAHVTRILSLPEESLAYWIKTLPWSLEYNNLQQIGTVLLNLGMAYLTLDNYTEAETYLLESKGYSQRGKDFTKVNQAQFYLIKSKLGQGQYQQAKKLYQALELELLPDIYGERITVLKKEISSIH
ncbi:hypothetical protein ACOYR1_00895 [Thalassotalea piscium]